MLFSFSCHIFNVDATLHYTVCNIFVMLCYFCSFKTKDVPSSGPYVVEAMKMPNGQDTFWETVLYNDTTKSVTPIGKLNAQQIEC